MRTNRSAPLCLRQRTSRLVQQSTSCYPSLDLGPRRYVEMDLIQKEEHTDIERGPADQSTGLFKLILLRRVS